MLDAWRGGTAPGTWIDADGDLPFRRLTLDNAARRRPLVREERAVGKLGHNSVGHDRSTGNSYTGRCIPHCGNAEGEGLLRLVIGHGRSLRIREVRLIGQLISRLRRG
jgi:hypothetical protein